MTDAASHGKLGLLVTEVELLATLLTLGTHEQHTSCICDCLVHTCAAMALRRKGC
jgi:hypothetical protein